MAAPVVSVVVPAYNRPERVRRAVQSVVGQSYGPLELVVVDDGSTPPLEESLTLPDDRLTDATLETHETNRGANAARNTGIDHASGEYVAFLDSDDEWKPTKIRRQVDRLEAGGDEAAYTGVEQVDANGDRNGIQRATSDGRLLEPLLRGNVVGTFSSVVVARDAIESVGRPDPSMPCWQDWEWFLRLSRAVSFAAVEDPLTIRHNEGGQISSAYEQKRDEAKPVIATRITECAPTDRAARLGLAYLDFQLGQAALSVGAYADARRHFRRAIGRHRREVRFYLYLALAGSHYPTVRGIKRSVTRLRQRLGTTPN